MMKSKFLTWGGMFFALCAVLMVSSCKDDDDNNPNSGSGTETPELPDNGIATAAFSGVVQNDGWGFLRGVTVTSATRQQQPMSTASISWTR